MVSSAAKHILIILVCAMPAVAQTVPNVGYYAGLSSMYPYTPVYCDKATGYGSCYSYGRYLPESAPLPPTETDCVWANLQSGNLNNGWYKWQPRDVAPDEIKFLGNKVCYFEDKGSPHNINDLYKSK